MLRPCLMPGLCTRRLHSRSWSGAAKGPQRAPHCLRHHSHQRFASVCQHCALGMPRPSRAERGAAAAPTLPLRATSSTSTSVHCASRTACSRLLTCAMARAACQPDPKPTTWGAQGALGWG